MPECLSDYLTGMLRDRCAAEVWAEEYASVAEAAEQLVRCAHDLGVGVYQGATLGDFAEATCRYRYVVVFAHWRGVMFRPNDFEAGVETVLDLMGRDPLLREIRVEGRDAESIVDALNAAVENQTVLDALPRSLAEAGRATLALGRTLCRDLIDEALSGVVKPGNRLELFDGLHTPSEVERALWMDFAGELDLAMCNSAALATVIDLRRGCRLHHLHWPQYLLPVPQFLKVEKTLRKMAVQGDDYIRTRLSLEEREPGRNLR